VVRRVSDRALLVIVAINDLFLQQCDVTTAFLSSKTHKEIYLVHPYGFEDGTKRVCKLQRALYGLAASPVWRFKMATDLLSGIGFEQLDAEVCIFIRNDSTRGGYSLC
jgi:hypothetical protein